MTLRRVTATDAPVPIACSLAASAAQDRESQWHALLSRSLIRRVPAPGGMRMDLRALPGVRQELERLIAAERDCCPFMTMSVETTDQAVVVLTVTTSELGALILVQLFSGVEG
jgi:hypothetical protein